MANLWLFPYLYHHIIPKKFQKWWLETLPEVGLILNVDQVTHDFGWVLRQISSLSGYLIQSCPYLLVIYNYFSLTSSLNLLRAIGYIICYNWRMLGYIIYIVLWPRQHRAEGKNNFPESASPVYSLPCNNFTLSGPHSTWCLLYLNLVSSEP